jgi:hypothetical protein
MNLRGKIQQNIAAFDLDFASGDFPGRIHIVLARRAIPFPRVPGADHVLAMDRSLPQRPASMWADPTEPGNPSAHVTDRIRRLPDHDFRYRIGFERGSRSNFYKWHPFSKTKPARQCQDKGNAKAAALVPLARRHGLP